MATSGQKQRILILGEAGSGKSSLIKLITGDQSIVTSDGGLGCTGQYKSYDHAELVLIDTTGLNEGKKGTVPSAESIKHLINFVKGNKDGFSLLVLVRRQGGRINTLDQANYEFFYKLACDEKVPIMLAITKCEMDDPVNQWWEGVKQDFVTTYQMSFKEGVSLCTADDDTIKKMKPGFQEAVREERARSRVEILRAIRLHALPKNVPLYTSNWTVVVKRLLKKFFGWFGVSFQWLTTEFEKLLLKLGLSQDEASDLAHQM